MASDARAVAAREAHKASCAASVQAKRHRDERDRLIRQLRAEDPEQWTYERLAWAVGISPEMIAVIVKAKQRRRRAGA